MRVPWTARRSNQSKEINPEYSLEGLILKLKLQYFGHLMEGDDSLEKTLMLGKIEGKNPMDGGAWKAAVHGVAKSRTGLSDFTFTFHFHALEKKMATHSSIVAWRIPGKGAWWAAIYGVTQSRTQLT